VQFLQVAQQFGPAGQMAINQDEALDFIADRLGVPARVMNSEEDKQEIMAEMQEQQQQQMMQEQMAAEQGAENELGPTA